MNRRDCLAVLGSIPFVGYVMPRLRFKSDLVSEIHFKECKFGKLRGFISFSHWHIVEGPLIPYPTGLGKIVS